MLLPLIQVDVRDLVGPIRMWPTLAILVLATIVSVAVDHRKPAPTDH